MPDPYSGAYFGYDEDPYGRPGGQTAASAYERMAPRMTEEAAAPMSLQPRRPGFIDEQNRTLWDILLGRQGEQARTPHDSTGRTGGAGDHRRNFWDWLFGRAGQEYMGPQEAYGPPGMGATGDPTSLSPGGSESVSRGAYGPAAPPKPVTALTSGQSLAETIRALINPAAPSGGTTLGVPDWSGMDAMSLQPPAPRQLPPYELPPYMSVPYRDEDLRRPLPSAGQRASAQATPGGNRFGGNTFGGNRFGGNIFGGNLFGPEAPTRRAEGGPVLDSLRGSGRLTDAETQKLSQAQRDALWLRNLNALRGEGRISDAESQGLMRAEGGPVAQRGGYPELYTQPVRQGYFASGGPSQYVPPDGRGDGRSDHIEARLSPGEYVMDAETTSLLGDGDSAAGARKLDQMRQNVRKQKGAKLAKGEISAKARPKAEEYMSKSLSRSALKNVGR